MSDSLLRFQKWYSAQCNGLWEHGDGIVIETLDNPGWIVKIDLKGTRWEKTLWKDIQFDNGSDDWVSCSKKGARFEGCGDPSKLEYILDHFLDQIATTK